MKNILLFLLLLIPATSFAGLTFDELTPAQRQNRMALCQDQQALALGAIEYLSASKGSIDQNKNEWIKIMEDQLDNIPGLDEAKDLLLDDVHYIAEQAVIAIQQQQTMEAFSKTIAGQCIDGKMPSQQFGYAF